jgi:hypothetical protein
VDEAGHALAWARALGGAPAELEDALAFDPDRLTIRELRLERDLGRRPALAWLPHGRALVVADLSDTLVVLDLATGAARPIARLGGEARALAPSLDGRSVAIAVARDGRCVLASHSLEGEAGPEVDLWSGDVDALAATDTGTVLCGERRGRVRAIGDGVGWSRAGRHVLLAGDGSLAIATAREVALHAPFADAPSEVLVLDDMRRAVLELRSLVLPTARALRATLLGARFFDGALSPSIALDPSGRHAAYASEGRDVELLELATRGLSRIPNVRGSSVAFSPAGNTLAVASRRSIALVSAS